MRNLFVHRTAADREIRGILEKEIPTRSDLYESDRLDQRRSIGLRVPIGCPSKQIDITRPRCRDLCVSPFATLICDLCSPSTRVMPDFFRSAAAYATSIANYQYARSTIKSIDARSWYQWDGKVRPRYLRKFAQYNITIIL